MNFGGRNALLAPPPWQPVFVPEDDVVFRLAQLLLLLRALDHAEIQGADLERLGYYDFLAANPLLVANDVVAADRTRLLLAGFDGRALSYASPSQRFVSRRERLQHDLVLLVAYGLVRATTAQGVQYSLTTAGRDLAGRFTTVYAQSYSIAADIILHHVRRFSPTRLRESVQRWLSTTGCSSHPGSADLLDIVGDLAGKWPLVDGLRPHAESDVDQ